MILAATLIPRPRVVRLERIKRIRGWAGVVALTASLGVAGSLAGRSWISDSGGVSMSALLAAEQRFNDLTNQRDALNARAASQAATLRAATAVSGHADWSILLAYIAKLGAGRITLDHLTLEPVVPAGKPGGSGDAGGAGGAGGAEPAGAPEGGQTDRGETGYNLRIRGVGRSQQDVASFVLGLDRSGVFASTRLEKSGGKRSDSGVAFSVACEIRPRGHTPGSAGRDKGAGG